MKAEEVIEKFGKTKVFKRLMTEVEMEETAKARRIDTAHRLTLLRAEKRTRTGIPAEVQKAEAAMNRAQADFEEKKREWSVAQSKFFSETAARDREIASGEAFLRQSASEGLKARIALLKDRREKVRLAGNAGVVEEMARIDEELREIDRKILSGKEDS